MIIRIVKLNFHEEQILTFKSIFEENKQTILAQKGCLRLELLQDLNDENTFFTYSWWDCEENLNAYRNSDWFKNIWNKTKLLFKEKPKAWSTKIINESQ
ncbi:MAG: antibiotic biosynthesis monooxygenase [Flavobacteriales bacterium]|nr:antibiotic biosynthesis monooxygenase [Flavobacteriales bacterium]